MELAITNFAAWSPTRQSLQDWQQWANHTESDTHLNHANDSIKKPKTAAIPAMTRRRLTLWGAMALEAACQVAEHIDSDTPTIFASRHGDTQRTYGLLESISQTEALSPTAFSLSVHNSSSGMFSIVKQVFANAVALAAGKETLGHALLEARNLLSQGHRKVMLVCCDQPLAEFYQTYADEVEHPHAFAMTLENADNATHLSHEPSHTNTILSVSYCGNEIPYMNTDKKQELSLSMQFLKFWYAEQSRLEYQGRRLIWRFTREPV